MPETIPRTNFNYGGQAVIEGVMMRGSRGLAVAVRNSQGDVVVHSEPLDPRIYGGQLAKIPFLRGITLLWDALGLGIKSLLFSAEVAMEEEKDDSASKVFEGPLQWGTLLLSLGMAVGLFFVVPAILAGQLEHRLELSHFTSNLAEGLIRLGLLIGYIWVIGFLPDIKRLYGYHGAEHKTINAYEAGAKLEPATVAHFPLEHPRCGTAFLLTVVVISILFFTLLPDLSIFMRVISRIALLPVIAGIAYEFIRFTAKNQDKVFIRAITKPNLALQHLTTREPDEGMLAVAITAFEQVLALEMDDERAAVSDRIIASESTATD